MPTYFESSKLLLPPLKRAAYSDRTAWIMAELSRLVYERLPSDRDLRSCLEKMSELLKREHTRDQLAEVLTSAFTALNRPADSKTEAILSKVQYELFNCYSVGGTEVMIVRIPPNEALSFEGMFVIVFRGTETTSLDDLKTDMKANLVTAPGGGRIHRGFLEAFQRVEEYLQEDLNQSGNLPIYITGHSLGGALAMVASRYLVKDNIGATYTFGSPRVADDEFYRKMKSPVYRIVNAADGVTRVPFGKGFSLLLSGIRVIPINGTKRLSEWLRKSFAGYTHFGVHYVLSGERVNERFRLRCSPSIFQSGIPAMTRLLKTRGKAALSDHSMIEYCTKLKEYALERQKIM